MANVVGSERTSFQVFLLFCTLTTRRLGMSSMTEMIGVLARQRKAWGERERTCELKHGKYMIQYMECCALMQDLNQKREIHQAPVRNEMRMFATNFGTLVSGCEQVSGISWRWMGWCQGFSRSISTTTTWSWMINEWDWVLWGTDQLTAKLHSTDCLYLDNRSSLDWY